MEWYQFVLVLWLGVAVNVLSRFIFKAAKETVWKCPYCSLRVTTDNKDFLLQFKTSHLGTHIL